MIKLAMIGLGDMGHLHMAALARVRGCEVTVGIDPEAKARQAFGKKFPEVDLSRHHTDALKRNDVDAVLICTPTLDHKQIAIDAMKSGRAVLTEKPMARTVADCRRMNDVADKTNKLLMVAHCRRFDKDWGKFGDIVTTGKLGRPVLWRSVNATQGPGRWFLDDKRGGGPMIDGAVHNYDFANLLFGDPDSVVASTIKLTKRSAVDTATAVVRYPSGDQLMMSWAWGPRGDRAHDVMGPGGTLLFGAGDLCAEEKGYAYLRTWPNGKAQKLTRFKYDFLDMYVAEDKHFIECFQGKVACRAPGVESIKAVAVAEAVFKAAAGNGTAKVRW